MLCSHFAEIKRLYDRARSETQFLDPVPGPKSNTPNFKPSPLNPNLQTLLVLQFLRGGLQD